MKNVNIFVLFICTIFVLNSCNNEPKKPTRAILKSVTFEDSRAERINAETIAWLRDAFKLIKANGDKTIDLQDEETKEISKKPQYRKYLSHYEARLLNDSTLDVSEFDAIREKINDGSHFGTELHSRRYVFCKNGDIEMLMGNMVSPDLKTGVYLRVRVDGATGLIVEYIKRDFGVENKYLVEPDGTLDIGNDYGRMQGGAKAKVATKTFAILIEEVRKTLLKIQDA